MRGLQAVDVESVESRQSRSSESAALLRQPKGEEGGSCSWCCPCCVASLVLLLVGGIAGYALCIHPSENASAVQTLALVDKLVPVVNWYVLPQVQSWQDLEKHKTHDYMPFERNGRTFATFMAPEAAKKMYDATKVAEEFDAAPDVLKGVFWVRGRGGGRQELVSMQLGRWFPDDRLFVSPVVPYGKAWPSGTPVAEVQSGFLYDPNVTAPRRNHDMDTNMAISYKFSMCPPTAEFCNPEKVDQMAYATMQMHPQGCMSKAIYDGGDRLDPFTFLNARSHMELLDGGRPERGSLWKQSIALGVGDCDCLKVDELTLTKILDQDGVPLEPRYTELLSAIGDVPFVLWTGWASVQARSDDAERSEALITKMAQEAGQIVPDFHAHDVNTPTFIEGDL